MLPIWITILAAWLGFTWGIYRLFKEADDVVKPKIRILTSKWLKNISTKKKRKSYSWVDSFLGLFHAVFTREHWTLKCLSKSITASTLLFILIGLLHYSYTKNNYSELASKSINNALDISFSGINIRHLQSILFHLQSGRKDTNGNFSVFEKESENVFRDLPINDSIFVFGGVYHKKVNEGRIQFGCFDKGIGTHIVDVETMERFHKTYNDWKTKIAKNPNSAYKIQQEFYQLSSEINAANEEMQLELDYVFFSQKLLSTPLLFIYFLIFNFFIDYISLFETRTIIYLLNHSKSAISTLILLIIDFILTLLIFLGMYYFMTNILDFGLNIFGVENKMNNKISSLEYVTNPIFIENVLNFKYPLSVVVYTTFFSSIWIWIFLIGGWLIKLVNTPKRIITIFSNYFDIENKPFRSIGFMIVLIISVPFLIWEIYALMN